MPALRWLLVGLYVVVVGICLASLPGMYDLAQSSWDVTDAAGRLPGVPFETLAAVYAFLNLALIVMCLTTAAVLLRQPVNGVTLLGALALTALPLTFVLGDASFAAWPEPLGGIVAGLVNVAGTAGLIALFVLLNVFPNGRFLPSWAKWPVIGGPALVTLLTLLPDIGDIGWFIFIGVFGLLITLAAVSQVVRYRRADTTQRRQTVWFMSATLAFPVALALAMTELIPGGFMLLFVPLILLVLGLAIAAGRGIWGQPFTTTGRWVYAGVVGVLLVATGVAAVYWQRENQPVVVDVAAMDTGETVPILFDADMAMDDITALFYLLQHPAVDLQAITINGVAFARCDGGVRNTLGLLEIAGAPDVPVSCGREEAYPGGTPAPDSWRDGADALYGGQVLLRERAPDPRPAAELFADTVRAAPGEIVVLAVGPLTNLAEAFEADPSLPGQIKEIVIMGGALDAPGNVALEDGSITNQYAEWNFFADPLAADIVLASGVPIRLVPLDATNQVPFSRGFHQQLTARHETKPATFVYNLFYMNPWWLDGGMYWWDTLAVAGALDNSLLTWRDANLDVVIDGGPEMGRLLEVADGESAHVAVAADAKRFEALLLAMLNK